MSAAPILGCNSSPRGDGNQLFRVCNARFHGVLQFIPARGRKRMLGVLSYVKICVAIHPREGTETTCAVLSASVETLQFIPARGRKPVAVLGICGARPCRCNSSPRGDGNRISSFKIFAISLLQFIPARGRKLYALFDSVVVWVRCNSSPRGDGNSLQWHGSHIPGQLQFIPARGRKRSAEMELKDCRVCCNSSPRGDGNVSPTLLAIAVQLTLQFIPARGRKLSAHIHSP